MRRNPIAKGKTEIRERINMRVVTFLRIPASGQSDRRL
jgi:hypothetical protein